MASPKDIAGAEAHTTAEESPQARFSRLLNEHVGVLYAVARTYCWHGADREELEQEIVLQLWRAFPRYDGERPFSTWMYRIALNVAISYVRGHTQRERHLESLAQSPVEPIDPRPGVGEQDERIDMLGRFLETLDPLNRALLLLYLEEHSAGEIADILGLSPSNVTTKISRLKRRVRAYGPASDVTE